MISEAYREAHGRVDEVVSYLSGLSHALYSMAHEANCITHGSKESNAIMTMINLISDKVEELETAQSLIWNLAKTAAWPTEVAA